MNYVITGGAGNISKPLSLSLLQKGHQVTVIGRSKANLQELIDAGAKTAIGSVDDVDFLTQSFTGADAVYAMVPPNFGVADWKAYIGTVGENYARAIAASAVKQVVFLSSVGADLSDGCGPVTGLYRAEQALQKLKEVNIVYLRPPYFYNNLFANIGLIKNMGIMGSNFSSPAGKFPIVAPIDIAEVAASYLLNPNFQGHQVHYLSSDETSTDEIAAAIGKAIGKPDLKWVQFSDEQTLNGMLQAGLPEEIAKNYTEMGAAIQSGKMQAHYFDNRPTQLGKIKLADFAAQFAAVYTNS
ncbi:MAG: NmrA family NAD(P)-binding protein [Sediminibacterium sp. Gen4]|jgi:uncharacterized protein YbjT (DUF2867 family)|uniref:NmrA family NAD(P)-binding protein n=1 Tax=unclassified Sediminibacterium TaxID=2635961 RepID=UPI0015BD9FD1|nr:MULTISPECIES: NmrA family NAD(P)-binding protein [unclassified Sediminibacterium]MBW0165520.1 NmrA family NAD(P)-binding protein [Sediminibacterium sp.]NWK64852.1 NmrA family NAD(P)-binding protein [Sediminibacterium sp. Gen4]